MATQPQTTPLTNWSGNYTYTAAELHRPITLDELRRLAATAPSLQVLGSRHSFTAIGDAEALVSLEGLPEAHAIAIDREAMTVTAGGAVTYARLAQALTGEGLALANLASLPHISVAGAIATGTHGSGVGQGSLATAVRGLQLITSTGETVTLQAGDPRLPGATVHLGALGVVTAVTLAVQPYYELRQDVFGELSWDTVLDNLDLILESGRSVSVFHDLGQRTRQTWVKRVADAPELRDLFGAAPATEPRHMSVDGDPVNTTEQLGVPGPWSERLPHFRSGFTPSSGEEIQSEFFVARRDGPAALRALLAIAAPIRPLILTSEVRLIAADALWLSPMYERETVALHFTWRREPAAVQRAAAAIEDALAGLAVRPHWGKVFAMGAEQIAELYPRLPDFRALRDRLDPRGAFVNPWLRERVTG
jgi:xylitol oxidase